MSPARPERPLAATGWGCRVALFTAVALAVFASAARAQPAETRARPRVLCLQDSTGDPFMAQVKAEISTLGLDVIVRAPRGSIETSARTEHAVAAVRILPARNGVEVWMADQTSGRSMVRQTIVDETPDGPNEHVIALQTAELLRTSLFPHPPAERARQAQTPPAPPPASGDSGVRCGVGPLYAAGGAGPAWQAWLSFQHFWNARWGIALNFALPLRRGTLAAREGVADVGAIVAAAEGLARFESPQGKLFLVTGLGAGLVVVLAKGRPLPEASAQLLGASSTGSTGLAYAQVAVGWKLSSWLTLGLNGLAGTTIAPVQIRFAGNDAGAWGMPVVGAAVFGQLGWR